MRKQYRTIAIHSTAWLLFLLYEWIFKQGVLNKPETSLFNFKIVAIRVLVLIPAVYVTLYYLVPQFFLNGKRMAFVAALIGNIMVATFVMKTLNYVLVLKGVEGFAPTYWKSVSGLTGWLIFMGNIAFNISFALMFFFINKWAIDEKKRTLPGDRKDPLWSTVRCLFYQLWQSGRAGSATPDLTSICRKLF
jgi:hypothetical protein